MKLKPFFISGLTLLICCASISAQVGINTDEPSENAALDIKNSAGEYKTVIFPQFAESAKSTIVPVSGTDNGMFFFNVTTGCFNYWSDDNQAWMTICGTPPPARGSVSDCSSVVLRGLYIENTPLTPSNYIAVPVNVTTPGTYDLSIRSAPDNGYFYQASGTFPSAGDYIVNVPAMGTPINHSTVSKCDTMRITFNGTEQTCDIPVFVNEAKPDYRIIGIEVFPDRYPVGTPLDAPETYYLLVKLKVFQPGFWQLITTRVNGYAFGGSGEIDAATGYNPNGTFPQIVTVQVPVANGQANSYGAGIDNFTLTTITSETESNMPFVVNLAQVMFSIECATIDVSHLGTLKHNAPVDQLGYITMGINTTAPGTTNIIATFAGLHYETGNISIASGTSTVTLNPVPAVQQPGQSGNVNISFASSAGGLTGSCNASVNITPAQAAFDNLTFNSITNNGVYVVDPLGGNHVPCNVLLNGNIHTGGEYTLTTIANGVTYASSGVLYVGTNVVTLLPSGVPTSNGSITYTLQYDKDGDGDATGGADGTLQFTIKFVYRSINILHLGGEPYSAFTTGQPGRVILTSPGNFGPEGKAPSYGFTHLNGLYNYGSVLKQAINNNKIDIIIVGFDYAPDATTTDILVSFVKNKKGVLLFSRQAPNTTNTNLINGICGGSVGTTIAVPTLRNPVVNTNDPILNGPFGDVRTIGFGGSDANDATYLTNVPPDCKTLAYANNGSASDKIWMFKHNNLGFLWCGDSGWMNGLPNYNTPGATAYPMQASATGEPLPFTAYSNIPTAGNGPVHNAIIFANAIAWAIDYAAKNTLVNYVIP
jgi:hypothetical protein